MTNATDLSNPPEKSILLIMREIARDCPDIAQREALQRQANELSDALANLAHEKTETNLRNVQCMWSLSLRMLEHVKRTPVPGGSGAGLQEGALLAKAA